MKKSIKFLSSALLGIAAVACGSPEKMIEMAENVTVNCEPAVLEVVAGKIEATVSVTYPAEYFHPKAILEVTPVIVYEGGEAKMSSFVYQGEKVADNYKVISSEGATVAEKVNFDYVPGMEKSYLELRGAIKYKGKVIDLPTRKVADGANTTYMLVDKLGKVDYKADNYQATIPEKVEGQILYSINSSVVKDSELKSASVKNFQSALDEILANERKEIVGTDIVAYASPDGGEELNTKLSGKRSETAEKAFGKIAKQHEIDAPVNVTSIGEDWEGFKELVSQSDIEDKDLIVRVLSMYSDPAVREKEIKNMSAVYKTLAKDILPELRRARFITNITFTNYSNDELLSLIEKNMDILDEEALLRVASLVKDNASKEQIYKTAVEKFDSKRAQYNLAVVYINNKELGKAKNALSNVEKDSDWQNAMGVIALREGNNNDAVRYFTAAGNETAKANAAILDILNGKYSNAVEKLSGNNVGGINKALAYVLTGQLDKASSAISCKCPKSSYLKAVIAARQGKADEVKANLEIACKNADLAERAAKDIEFAQYK